MIFVDRADWFSAAIATVFLLVFPLVIVAMWLAPREEIPLYFVAPFTAIFAFAVPFLFGMVRNARSRRFLMRGSRLEIEEWRPFRQMRHILDVSAGDISHLELVTTENDGYWYMGSVVVQDGDRFVFSQSGSKDVVQDDIRAMLDRLHPFNSEIGLRESREH